MDALVVIRLILTIAVLMAQVLQHFALVLLIICVAFGVLHCLNGVGEWFERRP